MSKLVKATFIILFMNLFSRLLGLVRDMVVADKFGATGVTDAFMVAYTLPFSLQAVLGMAFVSVIVPVVKGYLLRKEEEEGWEVVSSVINGTAIILGILTILGMIFAPSLVKIMAPGFDKSTVALTAHLTRIMFPSIIFMALGMLLTGVLNAGMKFTMPAFAPAFTNIIIILAVIAFGSTFLIDSLAYGTLAGFIGFLIIQIPNLKKLNFKYTFNFNWQNPTVKYVAIAILPIAFSVAVNQILLALNRFFASDLAEGSITALDYANRVMNLPLGIFVAAVTTAVFPVMSEALAGKDYDKFRASISKGVAAVTVTIMPAAVGMIILREPLIKVLFERGAFGSEATALTASALLYFSLGLWFIAVNSILTRAFYALQDLRTPTILGAICIACNALFSIILLPKMGHAGLALANTLAQGVNVFQLYYSLQKRTSNLGTGKLSIMILKTTLASFLMGLVVLVLHPLLRDLLGNGFMGLCLQLAGLSIIGALLYGAIILVFKVEEAQWFLNLFLKKLKIR